MHDMSSLGIIVMSVYVLLKCDVQVSMSSYNRLTTEKLKRVLSTNLEPKFVFS